MTGKFLIRLVGVATCMAVVASGWDAEAAGWRRHHRRSACCYETVCCEPVCCERVVYESPCCERVVYAPACCEPVCSTACCGTVRETVCCGTVRETVIVPSGSCCNQVVSTATVSTEAVATAQPTPAEQPTIAGGVKATPAALNR
ncbi:MAG: hypothetical protein ACKOWG_18335 [Planctomycetia bacterium]